MTDSCQEKALVPRSGWGFLIAILSGLLLSPLLIVSAVKSGPGILTVAMVAVAVVVGLVALVCMFGFMAIQPNDSRVLLLFG